MLRDGGEEEKGRGQEAVVVNANVCFISTHHVYLQSHPLVYVFALFLFHLGYHPCRDGHGDLCPLLLVVLPWRLKILSSAVWGTLNESRISKFCLIMQPVWRQVKKVRYVCLLDSSSPEAPLSPVSMRTPVQHNFNWLYNVRVWRQCNKSGLFSCLKLSQTSTFHALRHLHFFSVLSVLSSAKTRSVCCKYWILLTNTGKMPSRIPPPLVYRLSTEPRSYPYGGWDNYEDNHTWSNSVKCYGVHGDN